MTSQEKARREVIWQEVYQWHRARRAAELRDPDYWQRLVIHSLYMCWAMTWKTTALALYLVFLCELICFNDPPLPSFKPLFYSALIVSFMMMSFRFVLFPPRIPASTRSVAKP